MATPLCYTVIIPFFIALFLVGWIHPKLVKIALLKNIVDNRMPVNSSVRLSRSWAASPFSSGS